MKEISSHPGDLPDSYGETRVVLLPVRPYRVYVFWEVSSDELEKVRRRIRGGNKQVQAVLRFYDASKISSPAMIPHRSFDVAIDLQGNSRYISLRSPDRSYFVELGFKIEKDGFYSLARSNTARTPPDGISSKDDELVMRVSGGTAFQTAEKPLFKPHQPADQGVRVPDKKAEEPDLTEMCEKLFHPGISSKRNLSPQPKKGD
jgi:hypothetical protein